MVIAIDRGTYFELLSVTASTAAVRHVIRQRGHEPQLFSLRVLVDEFAIVHPENGPGCALRAFTEASHNRGECGQDVAPACEQPPHATSESTRPALEARPSELSRLLTLTKIKQREDARTFSLENTGRTRTHARTHIHTGHARTHARTGTNTGAVGLRYIDSTTT